MKKAFVVLGLLLSQTAWCGIFGGGDKEKAPDTVVRAMAVTTCPTAPDGNLGVEAFGLDDAAIAAKLIEKAVSYGAGKLEEAAAKDRENFVRSFAFPDHLYHVVADKQVARCLVVVAGNVDGRTDYCEGTGANKAPREWMRSVGALCSHGDLVKALKKWGISEPALYVEISFAGVSGASPSLKLPTLNRYLYRGTLSGRKPSKVKGLVLAISATAPNGDDVLSFTINPSNIKAEDMGKQLDILLTDKWVVLGKDESASDSQELAMPLNFAVSVVETPKPNKLLQQAAELVTKNKDDYAQDLKDKWIPENRRARKASQEEAEKTAQLEKVTLALGKCLLVAQLEQSVREQKDLLQAASKSGNAYGKQSATIALRQLALDQAKAQEEADAAWGAAEQPGATCTF